MLGIPYKANATVSLLLWVHARGGWVEVVGCCLPPNRRRVIPAFTKKLNAKDVRASIWGDWWKFFSSKKRRIIKYVVGGFLCLC